MKTGRTLTELAQELERQQATRRDFVAPSATLTTDGTHLTIGTEPFPISAAAHTQLAGKLGIPKAYYDRMPPTLLAANVNHWLHTATDKRLVRTLDGSVRAFLSDSYAPIDHGDVLGAMVKSLGESNLPLTVASSQVTDTHLFLKVTTPTLEREIKKGDVVRGGIMLRNSETGHGALTLTGFYERLLCTNGMVGESPFRRNHVGRKLDSLDVPVEYLASDTRRADDQALLLRLRDITSMILSEDFFFQATDKMIDAASSPELRSPEKAIKELPVTVAEGASVLSHLIRGGDLTKWGLANAVTRTAEDAAEYGRATELEHAGHTILTLPATEWQRLAA